MGLRSRRLSVANRDIHEGRSESGGFNQPKGVMRRWGFESGDLIWLIVISTKGVPNSEAVIGPKVSCTNGAPNLET
ncbi:hypothetical protein ACSBR2_005863 [Camellia fascicularis]